MKKYLNKSLEMKERQLKYDFLPPMLEIIEKPSHKGSGVIIWTALLLVITVFVWAYLGKLDIVVNASGVMLPEEDIISVQSHSSGVVAEICVEDGDRVKAGDAIFCLQGTSEEEQLEELRYEQEILQVQLEIYEKIYNDEDLKEIDVEGYGECWSVAEALLKENDLFQSRVKEYRAQIEVADSKAQAESALESLQLERELSVLQNISNLKLQIVENEVSIIELEEQIENRIVYAPIDGIITEMQLSATGVPVTSTQTVAYLLPEDEEMIFYAYVSAGDIDEIKAGDVVNIRLAAYTDSQYEIMSGEIIEIGEIFVNVDGVGTAYPVRIKVLEEVQPEYRVGLNGSCEVIVGQRTVLEYFLEPFIQGLQESMKE